ncbi:MAG: DNA polymerase [Pseudomonadota bacterium]
MLRSLYVDFNSYFASVEQQAERRLRGLPVCVAPVLAETTCCIAASYEAKAFGVKTGTPIHEARKLCKGIQVVQARPALYVEYHHKLVFAVESCTPVEAVYSIDEMHCELTGSQRVRANAETLAGKIKRTIYDTVGSELRCSIGIAPNLFLAKTASNMRKPDGLTVIESADLPECLYPLALRDINGVGRQMKKRLNNAGIHSMQDLWAADKGKLARAWGSIEGERIYAKLRGEWLLRAPSARASVGHSHVLAPELRNDPAAYSVLHRLLQKAAVRLRSYGLLAGAMQLKVKYLRYPSWHAQLRFDPTADTLGLTDVLDLMWRDKSAVRDDPLAVGVTLTLLSEAAHHTPSLFNTENTRSALNTTVDKLNTRFGKNAVYYGAAHNALQAAPMRIAFGHIPDLDTESDE